MVVASISSSPLRRVVLIRAKRESFVVKARQGTKEAGHELRSRTFKRFFGADGAR